MTTPRREWAPERQISAPAAGTLIAELFPELAGRRADAFAEGWDNTVVLLEPPSAGRAEGRPVVFRFPRRAVALPGIRREIAWLPELAARLPLPVPVPAWFAEWTPGGADGWPFWGSYLLAGDELACVALSDGATLTRLAAALGAFLRALHDLRPEEFDAHERVPLPVDPNGRAEPSRRQQRTLAAVARLSAAGMALPREHIERLLEQASALPSLPADGSGAVLCHGDLHGRHVLVSSGESTTETDARITGIIDWGDLCVADPSIDLPLAYSAFEGSAREAFWTAYGAISAASELRARALAVFLNAVLADYALELAGRRANALLDYALASICRSVDA